jgi:hypothetical protein
MAVDARANDAPAAPVIAGDVLGHSAPPALHLVRSCNRRAQGRLSAFLTPCRGIAQASSATNTFRVRFQPIKPKAAKPMTTMHQVDGSGIAMETLTLSTPMLKNP